MAGKQGRKTRWTPDPMRLPPVGAGGVRLLTGGNPQIAKGDGEAPVRAYLAAMPGWKGAVGGQIDAILSASVPDLRQAVRWNQPFYGVEGRGWFLSLSCVTRYVKVAFLRGAALSPMPPVASKHADVRYLHVFEDKPLDEAQFADWVRQAAAMDGAAMF